MIPDKYPTIEWYGGRKPKSDKSYLAALELSRKMGNNKFVQRKKHR